MICPLSGDFDNSVLAVQLQQLTHSILCDFCVIGGGVICWTSESGGYVLHE